MNKKSSRELISDFEKQEEHAPRLQPKSGKTIIHDGHSIFIPPDITSMKQTGQKA